MTALGLAESIFSRPQNGVEWNERRITAQQLAFLRLLLERDGQETRPDGPGVAVWRAPGRWSYRIAETPEGRRTLTRIGNVAIGTSGTLFAG